MRRVRVAVVQFPGVNCEFETARALRGLNVDAEILRWNRTEDLTDRYAGFVLPGGFSYQDRVRGGVIASREPVLERLAGAAARGLPILGICNGAQILVEAGLVPGTNVDRIEAALAPNRMPGRTGYHCDWIFLTHAGGRSFLSRELKEGETIPLPIAHGEGRFVSEDADFFGRLRAAGQIPLLYATPEGEPTGEFPFCPNGSAVGAAAVCNPAGNVVAMMPHPERAAWLHQVPSHLPSVWVGEKEDLPARGPEALFTPGPGLRVLAAFAAAAREVVT
ncbi:MAG: phosphoribosylformylglycinamidine synthase I [Candidatus Eisenbacteria bacterium]|nr:phosphoribosylformylglycinamidine synthase I [Candidatus Eisenbacteria bacterium]